MSKASVYTGYAEVTILTEENSNSLHPSKANKIRRKHFLQANYVD